MVHHDDSTTTYDDVRYTLTRHGLRILDTTGTETTLSSNDVYTTDVHTTPTLCTRTEGSDR